MGKSPGPLPILTSEHTEFLQKYYDSKSNATLKEAQESLYKHYGINITQSGLQKHLVNKCGLTIKKLEQISEYRNSNETIASRMNWGYSFEISGIDYYQCVFIDEASFNMHIKRSFGRSKRGKPAKALVSKSRGVNITILGAITGEGVVNLSLRRPQAAVVSKKRKTRDGE